jgi:hypothetical protein
LWQRNGIQDVNKCIVSARCIHHNSLCVGFQHPLPGDVLVAAINMLDGVFSSLFFLPHENDLGNNYHIKKRKQKKEMLQVYLLGGRREKTLPC